MVNDHISNRGVFFFSVKWHFLLGLLVRAIRLLKYFVGEKCRDIVNLAFSNSPQAFYGTTNVLRRDICIFR